jgi:hypothetical protein
MFPAFALLSAIKIHAQGCPDGKDEIATDRPDVTNSRLVVTLQHDPEKCAAVFRKDHA